MRELQACVREFHQRFKHPAPARPRPLDSEQTRLRIRLMREELAELERELEAGRVVEAAKELADLLYVTAGTAVAMGIDMAPLVERVHRSNMSKVWPDGTVHYDAGGKVIKPPTYQAPDIEGALREQGLHQAQREC